MFHSMSHIPWNNPLSIIITMKYPPSRSLTCASHGLKPPLSLPCHSRLKSLLEKWYGPPDRRRCVLRVSGCPEGFLAWGVKGIHLKHRQWYFGDACWSWLGARPRTALWQTGGNGTHAVRSAVGRAVGRTAEQDCGTGGRPTGYSLCKGSIPFGGSPRLPRVTYRKEKQNEKWDLYNWALEYEMEEKHNCFLMNETPNWNGEWDISNNNWTMKGRDVYDTIRWCVNENTNTVHCLSPTFSKQYNV